MELSKTSLIPNGKINIKKNPKLTARNIKNKLIIFLKDIFCSLYMNQKTMIKEGKKVMSNFVQKVRFKNIEEVTNQGK